ncbi:MAG: PAS domain-containing protein, partial [Planctomycetota bacterium]
MVSEPALSQEHQSDAGGGTSPRPRILCLGGGRNARVDFQHAVGDDAEVVNISSTLQAFTEVARDDVAGVYVDAEYFTSASDVGGLLRNDLILQAMPDGVVLLDADSTILWGNGRLRQWSEIDDVVGVNFYRALGSPDILGPEFCPFHSALATRQATASTLRCADNRYFRLHAAPVQDGDGPPRHLVVTIRDVSEEVLQQQKLAAIHQAGIELADLMPDDVANLDYEERIALLKDNILHCMQDVLQLDVIEIRMLDRSSGKLDPIMAVGMEPEAESRSLHASQEGNGVTGFVAATGKSYLCGHTTE